jgi:uncharacterized protein YgbK (DUF1537 family)
LLVVLDDDPTGSQAVHDMDVVTVLDPLEYRVVLRSGARNCFVITNSRGMSGPEAAKVNTALAQDLFSIAAEFGTALDLVSRSDSTLRGHVWQEVKALDAARRSYVGKGYDAVLFAPAFLEAGRITADDIHWARVGDRFVPVGDTEFARDLTFGFRSSNLREFVAEVSGGRLRRDDVLSLSLQDIRDGGPERIAKRLAALDGLRFVVVNATSYADLDTVALGALLSQRQGKQFLYRCGPSFVRSLAGQDPLGPLTAEQIWSGTTEPAGFEHGLIVVGSHVAHTSRQLETLRASVNLAEIVLDVPHLLQLSDGLARRSYLATLSEQVVASAEESDTLLYTSRPLVAGADGSQSLQIARTVSAALSRVVHDALRSKVAWFVTKGGITSHEIATSGLGIRRARVIGQLFPGMVSVFYAIDANPLAVGRPYVVFAGNVGDVDTLAAVVRRLKSGIPWAGDR